MEEIKTTDIIESFKKTTGVTLTEEQAKQNIEFRKLKAKEGKEWAKNNEELSDDDVESVAGGGNFKLSPEGQEMLDFCTYDNCGYKHSYFPRDDYNGFYCQYCNLQIPPEAIFQVTRTFANNINALRNLAREKMGVKG